MNRALQAGLPALALLLAACASGRVTSGTYVNDAKRFTVPLPPANWVATTDDTADLVLRHANRPAAIAIHASCAGRRPDPPLGVASGRLFFGIRSKEILSQTRYVNGHDAAMETVVRGELDGRVLLLHGYTFPVAGCLYDLVLFAAPPDYPDVKGEFETLARGFRRLPADRR